MARPRISLSVVTLALTGALVAGCSGGGGGSGSGGGGGGVGAQATSYLGSQVYTSLVVEIDYVQGHPPDSGALATFQQRLNERLAKPGGITVQVDDAIASVTSVYSVSDLQQLESQHRDTTSQGTTASLYLLYVDGHSDQDGSNGSVLGLTYAGSSIALFPQTIASTANAVVTADEVEAAVLVHELGHALGLVNLGTPMVTTHEDAAHAGHDTDDRCVMYYAIETTNIRNIILNRGTVPNQFCSNCIADLQAAGGP